MINTFYNTFAKQFCIYFSRSRHSEGNRGTIDNDNIGDLKSVTKSLVDLSKPIISRALQYACMFQFEVQMSSCISVQRKKWRLR